MELYDNAFSPFARKVRLVLDIKGIEYEVVDGLARSAQAGLRAVNPRCEVPTLVDGDVVVVNSADIVAYLDHRYPAAPMLPADPPQRVAARAWERCADTLVDAICTNISYWNWAQRPDHRPEGMLERAREEMALVYDAMERDLERHDHLAGALSIADIAMFPHITGGKQLGIPYDAQRHERVAAWTKRLRGHPAFAADLERIRRYFATAMQTGQVDVERDKIFWRGDRIEWVVSRGFGDWFHREIAEDRVLWPGPNVP